jgi:NADH:ubiquinone oxidoreductase subunit F (NADH-binding)
MFLNFLQDESCGKCVPCRIGTKRILEILTKITKRRAKIEDLDKLIKLAEVVGKASLCGLGQTVPNPLLSTIRHFKDEYLAHIVDKKCPAGVCSKRVVPKVGREEVKT